MIRLLILILLYLSGITVYAAENPDPFESYNRHAYRLNDRLDRLFLKPAAKIYTDVTPDPVMKGINHFFSNLDTLPTFVNEVLQFKLGDALSDAWRFTINSTIGVLGFFDVASSIGLQPHHQDFGLTLAHWGYHDSAYLVLPLFGPSTVRDALARPIQYEYLTVFPYIRPKEVTHSLLALYYVDTRAQLLDFEALQNEMAFDPYVFERNAYLQRRAYLVSREK